MMEYYILNQDPHLAAVFGFIKSHSLRCEIHLNRTRFWIDPHSLAYTEFALRFADTCPLVESDNYELGGLHD
jgi:hypothetical protein